MATFHKPTDFNQLLLFGAYDFVSHNFRLAFANDMDESIYSYDDIKEINTSGGYTKGGFEIPIYAKKADNGSVTIYTDETIHFETEEEVEPFQHIVLYTPDDRRKPIVCWWDYGEKLILTNEVLDFRFGSVHNNGSILTIL